MGQHGVCISAMQRLGREGSLLGLSAVMGQDGEWRLKDVNFIFCVGKL